MTGRNLFVRAALECLSGMPDYGHANSAAFLRFVFQTTT
jgi:hypothetical protein